MQVAAGCHHAVIDTGLPNSNEIIDERWASGWVFGLVPPKTVETAAAVDGRESTGHATGGARSVPGLGCHAIAVAPGHGGDPNELRRQLDRGLVVQRFSGSVDPASGDFSGVAKSARWVEGGEEQRSVRETLFSGNAFELLGRLIALSSIGEVVMGSAIAPWALIDDVSVTAG